MGRHCRKCKTFKPWDCFSKKPGGRNGQDSKCKDCLRLEQSSRRKKMRAKKYMVIDGENLVIESELVGDPSRVDWDTVARIIFDAYNNREITNV